MEKAKGKITSGGGEDSFLRVVFQGLYVLGQVMPVYKNHTVTCTLQVALLEVLKDHQYFFWTGGK